MNTRTRLVFILLGALLVAAAFTYPRWQHLVASTASEETGDAFPGLPPALQTAFQALPPDQQNAYRAQAAQNPQLGLAMVSAALAPPREVPQAEQALPDMSGPVVAATGEFQRLDAIRWADGTLTIYEQADAAKILRFENFSAINGPELRVVLSASVEPMTAEAMMLNDSDIDLGGLRGTLGSQNYEIPPELNLGEYNSVVIYSRTLNLVYSYAPLRKS